MLIWTPLQIPNNDGLWNQLCVDLIIDRNNISPHSKRQCVTHFHFLALTQYLIITESLKKMHIKPRRLRSSCSPPVSCTNSRFAQSVRVNPPQWATWRSTLQEPQEHSSLWWNQETEVLSVWSQISRELAKVESARDNWVIKYLSRGYDSGHVG